MKPQKNVRKAVQERQTIIAVSGLAAAGALGLTAYLLLGQPAAPETALVPVNTPTVRTQAPVEVPDLPFLVSTPPATKAATSTKAATGTTKVAPTIAATSSGIKNPFRPLPSQIPPPPPGPTNPGGQNGGNGSGTTTAPQPPVSVPPINPEAVIVVPPTPTRTNNANVKTPAQLQAEADRLAAQQKAEQLKKDKAAAEAVAKAQSVKPVVVKVYKTPTPALRTPPRTIKTNLPSTLASGTLSAIPPVLEQTISSANAVNLPDVATLPVAVPDTLSDPTVVAQNLSAGAAVDAAGTSGQVALINPGDQVAIPAPTPLPQPTVLERLVTDRELIYSSVVLGPTNTAIFRSKTGFVVVPLGDSLPNSEAVVQDINANEVVLALGNDKLQLNLDRR